jgi:hypothetical protein
MCVFVDNPWLHAKKDAERRIYFLGSIKEILLITSKELVLFI